MRLSRSSRAVRGIFGHSWRLAIVVMVFAVVAGRFEVMSAAPLGRETYDQKIVPLLKKYCYECHGSQTQEGGLSFEALTDYEKLTANRKLWDNVRQQLDCFVMPPVDAKSPSIADRRQITQWIDDVVFYCDPKHPDPGHITLRRLNRTEYNNTVRELFQVKVQPADSFPPDDSGYGFDNIGDVLSLSPVLMEKYIRAAQQVMDEAFQIAPPKMLNLQHIHAKPGEPLVVFSGNVDSANVRLAKADDEVGMDFSSPQSSIYRLTLRASVVNPGKLAPRVRVFIDGNVVGELAPKDVWNEKWQEWKARRLFLDLPLGDHRLSFRLANADTDQSVDKPTSVLIGAVALEGPFTPTFGRPSNFLREVTGANKLGLPEMTLSGEDFEGVVGRQGSDTGTQWFAETGHCSVAVRLSKAGRYRIHVKAGAQQVGDEPVRCEVKCDDRSLGTFEVRAKEQAAEWFELDADLPAGERQLKVGFLNGYKDKETNAERWLWFHEMKVVGPEDALRGPSISELERMAIETGRRVFRRDLTASEKQKIGELLRKANEVGETSLAAYRLAVETMLISPKFLFHPSPIPVLARGVKAEDVEVADVDEFTLANRLAYFIWSSPPDDELLDLASSGKLRANFRDQFRRMLGDPKSKSLTKNFAGQWLQLRDIDLIVPSRRKFVEFTRVLATDMKRESEMLFEHILYDDRSVLEFLNADYSFLNQRLADYYKIKGVKGNQFRKVSLEGTPRGGILTHGGILAITSHPTRTSPVKRGKYVLEQILGTPPPPAPGNVPPFEEKGDDPNQTLRQRFEAHRSNAACASCHAFLDPIGMALENYDAIGRWREQDGTQPVDAGGQLVTGEPFQNFSELRKLMVENRKDDFLRNTAEQTLTYALGRGLEYTDKLAVREIVRRTAEKEYRFQELMLAVCESVPFQKMRTKNPLSNDP